ncbi:PDZ domain, partial [Trinorchestia longiramus]
MFGFRKKDKDREDDKKKKKEKKDSKRSKDRAGMTREELWRLDEARKSLIGKGKKKKEEKLPSGITADYMDQFLSGLKTDTDPDIAAVNNFHEIRERYEAMASASGVQSDSSSDGVSQRSSRGCVSPPKRGILKGGSGTEYQGVQGNIDDDASLWKNTNYNEIYENLAQHRLNRAESQTSVQDRSSLGSPQKPSNGSVSLSPRSPLSPTLLSPSAVHPLNVHLNANMYPQVPHRDQAPPLPTSLPPATHPHGQIITYQSQNPRTNFTGGVPMGESAGLSHHFIKNFNAHLCLPTLIPHELPAPRTLAIDRLPAGDFGFSLRRTQVLERVSGRAPVKRTIIFAEPGSVGRTNTTGLLPGDRLLQVNGISVENKSREEIIELIKASADYVTLVVQPVKELSELSVRQCSDGRQVALDDTQIQAGTLRRQPKNRKNAP